jgi:rhodanese-related sulfurtransferase
MTKRFYAVIKTLLLLTAPWTTQAAPLITKISHQEVLSQMKSASAPVVFIDARAPDEFAEERIPGAVNLPLRAVATAVPTSIPRGATLVSYCIKDFRGYGVARALQRAGYRARVMDDLGLKGWKKAKLPTAGTLPRTTDL